MRIKVGATTAQSLPNPPQVDSEDLKRAQQDLAALAYEMPNVAIRVINTSMTGVKTDAKGVIRAEYNIKAGSIDKRFTVAKANRSNMNGYLQSKGGLISLAADISPAARMPLRGAGAGAGVVVNVKKSTGQQTIPRAFIAAGRNSGKLIVLRRPGKPRGQIENLYGRYGPPGSAGKVGSKATLDAFYGPHPEVLYNAPENWAKIQTAAAKRIDTNIKREVDAEFRRQDGKW